jgi:polysaccharide export outer membrane protein
MRSSVLRAFALAVLSIALGARLGAAQSPANESAVSEKESAQTDPNSANKAHDDSFVIGTEDVLSISVWNEPNLTRAVPVRSDGKISLPLIGEIQASGKTPLQLEQELTEKLKGFITSPQVNVIVQQINSRKYNVMGEVTKPGMYPLTGTTTIMDAIAKAGGFRDFAKKTGVYVLRKGPDGREEHLKFNYKDFIKGKNFNQNVEIRPNDTIIIP